jgi:hypothetical protein
MASRLSLAILVTSLVAAQDLVVAQVSGGDVTLQIPMKLTKLSTDITKVTVSCTLDSQALRYDEQGRQTTRIFADSGDVPVSHGQLVTTLSIVFTKFTLMINPAGVTATYSCFLTGTDRTGMTANFSDSSTFPQFRVTPTPPPLRGTFVW